MCQHLQRLLILVFFATLIGCSKVSDADFDPRIPIDFSVQDYTADVKGIELTTGKLLNFGVFAALETNPSKDFSDIEADQLDLFMDDVEVVKDKNGIWKSTPSYYWPYLPDKSLSFFAYTPYSEGTGIQAEATWGKDGDLNKYVGITYTLDSNPYNHVDLCVARAVLDRMRSADTDGNGLPDPVVFKFTHTLSSVSFAANYIGDLPEGCYLRIDELLVGNMVNTNSLVYTSGESDFFAWNTIPDNLPRTGSYSLNFGSMTLDANNKINQVEENSENLKYTDFVLPNGYIYALPQTINPEGNIYTKIDVKFSYVKIESKTVIAQFDTSIDLPMSILRPASRYKYLFTLDVTNVSLIKVSCENQGIWMVDWKDSNNNHPETYIK